MSFNRREFFAGTALAGAATALPFSLTSAVAQEAAAGQAPAFHRVKVGDAAVTGIADGHLALNASVFPDASEEEFAAAMEAAFLPPEAYTAPVNAYLVQSGGSTTLIDAGGSTQMAPTLGKLTANLEAAGVAPGDINTILITHLHPDHIGGLMAGGGVAFPDTEVKVREEEVAFWTDPATRAAMPEGFRPMVDGVVAMLEAYGDQVTRFSADGEMAPGIEAVFLPGHTPGHTGFRVGSGDDALLIWGDVVHAAPLQMPNPRQYIGFDTDGEQAVKTRLELLDQVATDRLPVAGMHMPFPGFGHIAPRGEGFEFVVLPWQYGG
ncbi:MAG: MBL fold metallo-hydrolase [Pseudomonadota bacterium]